MDIIASQTAPAMPTTKLSEEISLELALERSGLEISIPPGIMDNRFEDYTLRVASIKSSDGLRPILYHTDTRELIIHGLPFHGLRDDLMDFRPYAEGTGTFVPLSDADASVYDENKSVTIVRVDSQKGLDLFLGLVNEQLSLESWTYYDNGLLFSRLDSAEVPLPGKLCLTLTEAAQRAIRPERQQRYEFIQTTQLCFDGGIDLRLRPHNFPNVRIDLLPVEGRFNTHRGKLRLDFLLRCLSANYPHSPQRVEDIRNGVTPEYGVQADSQVELERLVSFLDESLRVWESSSEIYQDLISKLHQVGVPEEALWENRDFWNFVTEISANQTISRNYTFYVHDEDGRKWLLKANKTKDKAEMEAAYNYYLSLHFEFVARGHSSHPIKLGDNLYFTLQEEVSSLYTGSSSPLEHKLACLARFHREAADILKRNGIEPSEKTICPLERMDDDFSFLRGGKLGSGKVLYSLPYDHAFLREVINYLTQTDYKVLVHGDVKRDNWVGKHLVDGEEYGFGHPALDLALLFMQEGLPKEKWGDYLHRYLVQKNNGSGLDNAEEEKLREGMCYAPAYVAVKEILGSTLRECSRLGKYLLPETRRDNIKLCRYTEEELRGIAHRR